MADDGRGDLYLAEDLKASCIRTAVVVRNGEAVSSRLCSVVDVLRTSGIVVGARPSLGERCVSTSYSSINSAWGIVRNLEGSTCNVQGCWCSDRNVVQNPGTAVAVSDRYSVGSRTEARLLVYALAIL